MAGLARVSSYIRKTHDFSLSQVVEMLRVEYGIYHVRLFTREQGGARLLLTAATGQTPEQLLAEAQAINIYGSSTAALAVRQKAPVRTGLASPLAQREDFLSGAQAELAVPLLVNSQVTGVLLLQSEQEDALDGQEIKLLTAFVDELVFALQRQHLQQELKHYKDELEINAQLLAQAQRDFHRLKQEVEGKVWENYLNQQRERVNLRWNSDGTVATWHEGGGAVTQQPSLETTPQGLQRLVVPVRAGNQVLGEMVFESSVGTVWTKQTLDLVIEVAERLSLALENVRLFDQAQTIAFREQTVGSIAAELQDARSIGVLLDRAATIFNQVLGAQQTYIRLGDSPHPDAGRRESLP
jgi:GAF domain-containing protein